MAKEKSISGGNRTYRLNAERLQMLKEIAEKLDITENACVSLAILRLWEEEQARGKGLRKDYDD
jgi:hypothetical protein